MENRPRLVAYRLRKGMPIISAQFSREWMNDTGNHAYRCLPMTIANQAGWLILNGEPFVAIWEGGNRPENTKIILPKDGKNSFVESQFGYGIITWKIPYLFRTSPGYNLLARGPANWPKDGISPLEGIVETDWLDYSFTMNWKITRPRFPIAFGLHEPICMIVPRLRNELESFSPEIFDLHQDEGLEASFKQWDVSRRTYMKEKKIPQSPASRQGMQGHYFRGDDLQGNRMAAHQTRLHLKEFVEGEGL